MINLPIDVTANQIFNAPKSKDPKTKRPMSEEGQHYQEKIPLPPLYKRNILQNCKMCTKKHVRKQTQYQCKACNVLLCPGSCFEDYMTSVHHHINLNQRNQISAMTMILLILTIINLANALVDHCFK
ncbi:unnamed protein product [Macrosiphum euphorbiae]|uniref:PiggyBac transposable element-derived protein 4 C-terminal zinc-ribbon domain-containing protein n=1 Tax=Macrosiphum euphorbiae TaxID=13131 RepID=A0AAV0XU79_9HEMI|nr:unnamed protein product [Macrosiphum euphorbiae]